jgi:hypothetical protein
MCTEVPCAYMSTKDIFTAIESSNDMSKLNARRLHAHGGLLHFPGETNAIILGTNKS